MEALGSITYHGGAGSVRLVGPAQPGLRHLAVAAGGPADMHAYQQARQLLGLPRAARLFETALRGGLWSISGTLNLTLTGSPIHWQLNGKSVECGTILHLQGTNQLTGATSRGGPYAYLAVGGAIVSTPGLPAYEPSSPSPPSSLPPGTTFYVLAPETRGPLAAITPREEKLPPPDNNPPGNSPFYIYPAPETNWLTPEQRKLLSRMAWKISPQSNRHGVRLMPTNSGAHPDFGLPSLISSPVLPGTVQISPGGLLILGPDAHTVGGYPRVGCLTAQGLSRLYRKPLGSLVRLGWQ